MGYTVVKSFDRGLDTRRLLECIEPGSLLEAVNVHVTRGGELEKRAAFVQEATLPATTMGFFANEGLSGTLFHTFGDALTQSIHLGDVDSLFRCFSGHVAGSR